MYYQPREKVLLLLIFIPLDISEYGRFVNYMLCIYIVLEHFVGSIFAEK